MTNVATQISNLLMNNGKSAADMTHAIKIFGDGNMQNGLAKIGTFFAEEAELAAENGLIIGRIQGGIIGFFGTVVIVSISAYALKKMSREVIHKEKGQSILTALEQKTPSDENIRNVSED